MIKVKSPAKINLYLNIISKLESGYHEIDSAFQLIDIYDDLIFEKSSGGIQLDCDLDIETHENIVYKAALLLNEQSNKDNSIRIKLHKNIPTGSGIGGGSSNAASTLVTLNKLCLLFFYIHYFGKYQDLMFFYFTNYVIFFFTYFIILSDTEEKLLNII